MSYSYVVTAQKPTSVVDAITGHFTSSTEVNLIISKGTRLEIHTLTPDGLQPFLDIGMYGRISSMHLFRPEQEEKDLLLISTEEYRFCVLEYDESKGEIVTRSSGDVSNRSGKPVEHAQLSIVDPAHRMIVLSLYTGILTVVPMDPHTGKLSEAFTVRYVISNKRAGEIKLTPLYRMEEINVLDIKFLEGTEEPTIAVLFQGMDKREMRFVTAYPISLEDKQLGKELWGRCRVEAAASMLVAMPKTTGGVLVVGDTSIAFLKEKTEVTTPIEATSITAVGKVDPDGSRFLVGDMFGEISVLLAKVNNGQVTSLSMERLGTANVPSTLTYLDNGVVFIGSLRGDSQLVRLQAEANEEGSYLEYLDSFTNLGPIVDFVVVDLERQGQGQIVTCSGAFGDGSLRIIRNGIGINEQAAIDLPGVKGVWSLKEHGGENDKYLVVSFVGQTRILAITDEVMSEVKFEGIDSGSQTLLCANITGNAVIQVTETQVRLLTGESFNCTDSWQTPAGSSINIASANSSQLVVSLGGGKLVYFDLTGGKIVETSTTVMEHEVSCINLRPLGGEPRSQYCAVGLWTDISLRILALPSLEQVTKEVLGGEFLPRSVIFASFDHADYVLCAMGDGHLFTFRFAKENASLHDRKKISLGTKPILLEAFQSKDVTNVFAASDRPTVIYSNTKKLLYSNVNLKEVDYMCPFNASAFPESLAIIGEDTLTIGTIDDIQKLHIRSVPLGEMPRRITHHDDAHAFVIATIQTSKQSEEAHLRVMDDQTFELTDSYHFEGTENATSLDLVSLEVNDEEPSTCFVAVGTACPQPGDSQISKGRILLFKVDANKKLQLVSEKGVDGAVYCIKQFEEKIVAGINGTVALFRVEENRLELEASYGGNTLALQLATRGNICAVADLMRSVSILHWNQGTKTFSEIARDTGSAHWMTAVEIIDDDNFIGAEGSYNLFALNKNSSSEQEEERSYLSTVGEFHVGEAINKLRHGSLVMKSQDSDVPMIPTILFGTVNGSIGIIASLSEEEFAFYEQVQASINQVIKGVGGFEHSDWRSFRDEKTVRNSRGFIDGDLVESFLDLSVEKMQEVVAPLGVSVEELCKRIEDLSQALH